MFRKNADLLVEVGTEELPPKALRDLMNAFGENLAAGFDEHRLEFGEISTFASPRRLAVITSALSKKQDDRDIEMKGPPVKVAFDDDGNARPAATAFAEKCGVDVEKLERVSTDKGEWLGFTSREKGRTAAELLPQIVQTALENLPIPRRMRWGDSDVEFVRPVHWVVLLHGKKVVPGEIMGVKTGARTRGHRFLAPAAVAITEPARYAALLEKECFVIADFDARRETIEAGVRKAAAQAGGTTECEDELYDEVAALNEWPVPLTGEFDERFLELPKEVIVATLTGHQRYFPIVNRNGGLLPAFVTVANIESKDPDVVRHGNERVIRPRLADAAFFWETDQKTTLAVRQAELRNVVYQRGLGSLADKSGRVARLAVLISEKLDGNVVAAERAALLAKCDLVTGMVGEFPELQGIIGSYYAQADGEALPVSLAIAEQYLPRFAGDQLPEGQVGLSLAMADRLDTLAGIFVLGKKPSGNRDPFGLRRAALGVVRMLVERSLDLDLNELVAAALEIQPGTKKSRGAMVDEVYEFIIDRMRGWYLDRHSVSAEMFEAVRARRPTSLLDFDQRLVAVSAFVRLDAAESLAAANKRIANILRKADMEGGVAIRESLLSEEAEKALFDEVNSAKQDIAPLMRKRAYADALTSLARLRPAVDCFFDGVLVMDDDENLRNNRLALLGELRALFLDIADISKLSLAGS